MRPVVRAALVAALGLGLWVSLAGCDDEAPPTPAGDPSAPVPIRPKTVAPVAMPPEAAPSLDDPGTQFNGTADGKLHVWFLDVGHGDAILIRAPSGRTVLIDGGPPEAAAHLSRRLPDLLQGPPDMVVVTHAHPDHFGALPQVLQVTGLKRFLAPRAPADAPEAYAQLVRYIESKSIPVFVPAANPARPQEPLRIALGDDAALTIFWPRQPIEDLIPSARPLDANSMVMRLEYRDASLLLAGDATRETEERLLAAGFKLRSTLLKVGAHGGDEASSAAFLEAVKPEAAIILAGAGNNRGAPARQTLSALEKVGARVFRTDLDGEIRADSDGKTFVLITERPAAGEAPDTPHIFGAGDDSEAGAELARAVAAEVASKRSSRLPEPDPTKFGKVIEVPREEDDGPPSRVRSSARGERSESTRAAGGRYVASRNSEVFHAPDCPAAKRIHKKNLVTYRSRAEASQQRRPAGDCKP